MIRFYLRQQQWYRKLVKGKWVYLRIDLGQRPMFWTKLNPEVSLSEQFAHSHTILETEDWDKPDTGIVLEEWLRQAVVLYGNDYTFYFRGHDKEGAMVFGLSRGNMHPDKEIKLHIKGNTCKVNKVNIYESIL